MRGADAGQAASQVSIAIDGPAASGKSTVGHALAADLGLLYLDTGAMYRAVTWLARRDGIDPNDETAVTALAEHATFEFPSLDAKTGANPAVFINGIDATRGIREPDVDRNVSVVSSYQRVRAALVQEQRRLARERGVVMVGRDIGTVVLPDAAVKIYLDASAESRARRRYEERLALGKPADYESIRQDMLRRDRIDSERAHSPLKPAPDSVIIDTTGMSVAGVVSEALRLAHQATDSAQA